MKGRLLRGFALAVVVACGEPAGTAYPIGQALPGIGFDDLRYSAALHRVLVPGGRAGVLALLQPETGETTTIPGFSTDASYDGGHDFGVTAVDEGRGLLFATDRTAGKVHVVDPAAKAIVSSGDLGAHPDYVRYVSTTDELWITEPGAAQIEIFALSKAAPPILTRTASVAVANGPESLVIDTTRGRAYTHRWQSSTVAIDLKTRAIVAEWPNGCAASRGIDFEPEHGYVLVACNEGTVSVLDASRDGRILSTMAKGSGYDVMGYSRALRHLYLAGSACSCLTVLGLSSGGRLDYLGREDAPSDTHCAAADDVGNAWVCEPSSGSVRKVADRFPRSL
jgi:hypothetical protein